MAITPNTQTITVDVIFLFNIILSFSLPVLVSAVWHTTSSAGNAWRGNVKMTAMEYANCTSDDNIPFGRDAVSAVWTESPNDALYENVRNVVLDINQASASKYGFLSYQQIVANII